MKDYSIIDPVSGLIVDGFDHDSIVSICEKINDDPETYKSDCIKILFNKGIHYSLNKITKEIKPYSILVYTMCEDIEWFTTWDAAKEAKERIKNEH